MGALVILIVIGVVAAVIVVALYNGLVGKRVETTNAWSQIDVQLKRRYDLIPNLVETVKGYAAHERDTLQKVIEARNHALSANGVAAQAEANAQVTGALRGLLAVAESYPDLKANQNFLALQEELTSTENRIGFARQHYNDSVGSYNAALQSFPTNIMAGMFGFKGADFFQLDSAEAAAVRTAPVVKFS